MSTEMTVYEGAFLGGKIPTGLVSHKLEPLTDAELEYVAMRRLETEAGDDDWKLIYRMIDHYLTLRGREHLLP